MTCEGGCWLSRLCSSRRWEAAARRAGLTSAALLVLLVRCGEADHPRVPQPQPATSPEVAALSAPAVVPVAHPYPRRRASRQGWRWCASWPTRRAGLWCQVSPRMKRWQHGLRVYVSSGGYPTPPSLTAVVADLPGPRVEAANKLHELTDVRVVATCAVIAGAGTWGGVAGCGRAGGEFFHRPLELRNGTPATTHSSRCSPGPTPSLAAPAGGCDRRANRPVWCARPSTARAPGFRRRGPSPGACTRSRPGPRSRES